MGQAVLRDEKPAARHQSHLDQVAPSEACFHQFQSVVESSLDISTICHDVFLLFNIPREYFCLLLLSGAATETMLAGVSVCLPVLPQFQQLCPNSPFPSNDSEILVWI